jgi:hypothetical protein
VFLLSFGWVESLQGVGVVPDRAGTGTDMSIVPFLRLPNRFYLQYKNVKPDVSLAPFIPPCLFIHLRSSSSSLPGKNFACPLTLAVPSSSSLIPLCVLSFDLPGPLSVRDVFRDFAVLERDLERHQLQGSRGTCQGESRRPMCSVAIPPGVLDESSTRPDEMRVRL